ncbi:DNA adenine methylase [Epilithonimonas zeae]|uniref:site-specific DNA-methyltransferase (adenine-specific) n=1 Tax=Epilithonimonas zeae TaxID=1416779 RepID=A0A1N6JJG9_9FLAO|nr:DNA adenine methylase [Epilithonimonas zeae]SIO44341.1 adenine-specific DNA-methyltransferase [Epilithonimonas zeae]
MNYIGSKNKLSDFIRQSVYQVVGKDLSNKIFCDLFAGTGIVGRNFKAETKKVISNDFEFYSFVLNRNYIGNHQEINYENLINELNSIEGKSDFISEEYSENGKSERLYFSEENGKKIDAIRQKIEDWKISGKINEDQYYFLLCSLLEAADKIANTASVYGAFLKQIKKSAQKKLELQPANFELTKNKHEVYNEDANELIKKIEGDILYLDPPYNARQYGANYHLLNTIAKYDNFSPKGKTGLRNYQKSKYCSKIEVSKSFEDLIENAKFQHIFLSYNNEGLMTESEIRNILSKFGKYDIFTTEYQRFRADKEENRNHKASETIEYLYYLLKE